MIIERRKVLSGIFATSAIGFAATEVSAGADPHAEMPAGATERVVSGSGLRLSSAGGALPGPGDSVLLSAELLDEASGLAGSMHGVYLVIDRPGAVGTSAPTSIETHYFDLPGGTIVGTGTASLDDSPDHFVILGGTGSFAGARGAYAATQHPIGAGGDGSATYHFSFIIQQGA